MDCLEGWQIVCQQNRNTASSYRITSPDEHKPNRLFALNLICVTNENAVHQLLTTLTDNFLSHCKMNARMPLTTHNIDDGPVLMGNSKPALMSRSGSSLVYPR